MRIPAAIAAASLTLTPATPVEQLLIDVSATHTSNITAINSAETDDEVRDVLIQWRKELIAAEDELAQLREDAAEDGLTAKEEAAFEQAEAELKRERAGVRGLRSELLPEDAPVVVPAPIEGLGGILGTTAFDAYERSEDGDAPIVFGIPGVGGVRVVETSESAAATPTTQATVAKEPTTTTPGFGPEVTHRVERLQDTTTTTTETSTSTTESSTSTSTTSSGTATESATATTTVASTTTTPGTTTSATTTASVLQNRTTSATSSSTTSSSTSSTTSRTTSATTTDDDDDERDGDLAETGTPMRALITIGVLSLLVGAALVLTGAIRPRGARK